MARTQNQRIEFIREEPGAMLLLLIVAVFLAFSPGGACSVSDHVQASHEAGAAGH